MSDGLTDVARDERRGRLFNQYLESLRAFLQNPTKNNKNIVLKIAAETDDVPRGYWGGSTSLAKNIEARITLLRRGNKKAWAKFLFSLKDESDFKAFKALSPFAGKFIIAVDYGFGFVNFHGDLEPFINAVIRDGKGWKTYEADNYIIALDRPNIEGAEVFWTRDAAFSA